MNANVGILNSKYMLEWQKNDRAKRLTMLVHKSQPRNHLKHDVPNFILCEHLSLPKHREDDGVQKNRHQNKERQEEEEKENNLK